jgi:hypothetical protein
MLPCRRSVPSTVPFWPIRADLVRNFRVSENAASRRTQNGTRAYVREVWLTMIGADLSRSNGPEHDQVMVTPVLAWTDNLIGSSHPVVG